jgi:hypothetical protein
MIDLLSPEDILGTEPDSIEGDFNDENNNLFELFPDFVNAAFVIAGVVLVIMIIYYGFKYLFQGGNETEVKKAKSGLVKAIIGFVIVLFSFTIAFTVNYIIRNIEGTSVTVDEDGDIVVPDNAIVLDALIIRTSPAGADRTGVVGQEHGFVAEATPGTEIPMSFTWEATDQDPVEETRVRGRSNYQNFRWSEPGTKTITVVAENSTGSARQTFTFEVIAEPAEEEEEN